MDINHTVMKNKSKRPNNKKLSKKERVKKKEIKENKQKQRDKLKTARVSQWSPEERFEHTKNVVPKMKEMGLGVYAKEVSLLETIVDNYVYKGIECTYTLPLKGAKKNIVIKLLLDRSVLPMIKLSAV